MQTKYEHSFSTINTTTVGNGILKDVTKLVVETDEDTPTPIVTITPELIDCAKGYRVRMTPDCSAQK